MAFNIDNFTANFNDLARSYMFKCIFSPPAGISNPSEKLSVLVESTVLPTKNIAEVEANFMGQQVKLAGNVTYENWACTLRMDASVDVYRTFREWMDKIRNVEGFVTSPKEYKGGITLEQLDGEQNTVGTAELFGAFPITLGEIGYDTKASDIQTFAVTFAYDYHTWQ